MITFEITCPHCNNTLNIVEEANGREITCLHCGNRLIPDLGIGIEPQNQTQPLIPTDTKSAVKTKGVPTMAKFIFTCPHCMSKIDVPSELDGKTGQCPKCRNAIRPTSKKASFKEPLIATTMQYLAVVCYIGIGLSFLPVLFTEGKPEGWIVFISTGIVCLFQAVIYQALSEYFSRSLRYQWETSENTKQLVEMLRK